jgi:GGDEF domain-containing protein
MSFGGAIVPIDANNVKALIEIADKRMYQEKARKNSQVKK